MEADELWSFVVSKDNQVWRWLAIDAETHLIVGCAIGLRDKATADELWYSLPPNYRQRAVVYTDFLQSYAIGFPAFTQSAEDRVYVPFLERNPSRLI